MTMFKSLSVAALCVVFASQFVCAQGTSRIKTTGEAMQGHEHATYQQLGQARAQILYYNAQSQEPVPVAETKELVVAIQKDLKASDAALAKIKAQHPKEPEVLKQIALIEKFHAKAREACDMADEASSKPTPDQVAIGSCCSTMYHELDAAQVETQKLLKMLKIEKIPAPAKTEAAKAVAK